MWIAHLKPSLAQQVNEAPTGLRAMPENQIVNADCLLVCKGNISSLIRQYTSTGNLDYIDSGIPGTPGMGCRIKAAQQPVAVPQKKLFCQYATPTNSLSTKASPMPVRQHHLQ